ncbi:hypothetical protein OIV83_001410 [Microbotryomycetes sp. JL201]|nr:hypothetical protein OIV83_001410 [Microbotryomycetes sp. JL201]
MASTVPAGRVQSTFAPVKLNDGQEIPGIHYGVGTAWYGRGLDPTLISAVKTAIDVAGYTSIDNAQMYANEESVGQALKELGINRDKLYITSKVGSGIKDIRATLQDSLKKLGLDYLDLCASIARKGRTQPIDEDPVIDLIHTPTELGKPGCPDHAQAWQTMEQLKDEGLVKSIGVSNYRISDLEKTIKGAKYKPAVNQIEFHPFVYEKTRPLQDYMNEHGIVLQAYGPTVPVAKNYGGPFEQELKRLTKAVSERAGSTIESSQVMLKLAQQRGAVLVTTSGKDWRMKQQLLAGGIPDLTSEEMAQLQRAVPGHRRQFMPHMDKED